MNRRGMILMVLAMAVGTLAYDAKAAWIKRWLPEESFPWPQGKTLYFQAEFGGLFWPYLWHEAQLYVNGVLKESQPLGGTAGYTWLPWKFDTLGTVEIKVRARYDSVPFGVDVWTDYVTWTVEVYAHPPSASRVSPDSPVTVSEGDTQAFTARNRHNREVQYRACGLVSRWRASGRLYI